MSKILDNPFSSELLFEMAFCGKNENSNGSNREEI